MSKMSHDRVHFTIRGSYLEKKNIRDCIEETLGILPVKYYVPSRAYGCDQKDLHVICRPSQFARFVILRHVKYGEPNNMACLNMRLVVPENKTSIDVSAFPNTITESVPTDCS